MKNKISFFDKGNELVLSILDKLPISLQVLVKQFLLYAVMGIIAFSVDYLVYLLLIFTGVYYIIAALIAGTLSALTNFLLNKKITFKNNEKKIVLQVLLFITIVLISLALNAFLMYVIVDVILKGIGIPRTIVEVIARPIVIILMLPVNFGLNKCIVYNKKIYDALRNKKN